MKRASFNDPFKGEKGCYHLSSSHLEKQSLFRSDSDFIFGVNTQALLLPLFDVSLIAVVLRIAQHSAGQYGISGIHESISFSDQELRERIFVMTYLLPKDSEDRPGDILSALRLWNAI